MKNLSTKKNKLKRKKNLLILLEFNSLFKFDKKKEIQNN